MKYNDWYHAPEIFSHWSAQHQHILFSENTHIKFQSLT